MSDEQVLTKEIAEQFLADEDSVDLSEFTTIDDDAAEVLSKYEPANSWDRLKLYGLRTLSDESARSLSRLPDLWLDGLTELTDSLAVILGASPGTLHLGSLKSISIPQARHLCKARRNFFLGKLDIVESKMLHIISEADFLGLELDNLSDEQATALSTNTGELRITLTSLSSPAAEILRGHSGLLTLAGIRTLTDSVAALLSEHHGELSFFDLYSLQTSPGHIALAKKLVSETDDLEVSSLVELSDEAAEILASYEGETLGLDSLAKISDDGIRTLSKSRVEHLSLDGLTHLSDAAAESLGRHEGSLYLNGLPSLSDAAAKSLCMHQGTVSLDGVKWLSDSAKATFQECNVNRENQGLDLHDIDLDAVLPDFDSMADVREYFTDVELRDE